MARAAAFVLSLLVVACDCGAENLAAFDEDDPAVPWSELSHCLAGDEPPTRELLRRIELAADTENVSDVPAPPTPAGRMGAEETRNRPDDVRRWPRRCAHHARDLAHALDGAEATLARQAVEGLEDGELNDALFELVDHGRAWHTVDARSPTPPPEPASPLARRDVPYLVEGPDCVAVFVLPDAASWPLRHVAHVVCGSRGRYTCTVDGAGLDQVVCTPSASWPDVWSLHEARAGDWRFSARRGRGDSCVYEARGEEGRIPLGEAVCGSRGPWVRPCRTEATVGALFAHIGGEGSSPSQLALADGASFRLVDSPVQGQGDVHVSCDAEAMRLTSRESRIDLVDTPPRTGDFRRPMVEMDIVVEHRCSAAGCTRRTGEVEARGRAFAAPLGDGVLLVELVARERGGDGLVALTGPLEELGDGAFEWILDPADGAELQVRGATAVGPTAAVVFLSDEERGVFAIRFDADGEYAYLAP